MSKIEEIELEEPSNKVLPVKGNYFDPWERDYGYENFYKRRESNPPKKKKEDSVDELAKKTEAERNMEVLVKKSFFDVMRHTKLSRKRARVIINLLYDEHSRAYIPPEFIDTYIEVKLNENKELNRRRLLECFTSKFDFTQEEIEEYMQNLI